MVNFQGSLDLMGPRGPILLYHHVKFETEIVEKCEPFHRLEECLSGVGPCRSTRLPPYPLRLHTRAMYKYWE